MHYNNQRIRRLMATKQHVTKSGDTWEWEETPEVTKALEQYWKTVLDSIVPLEVTITDIGVGK